MSSENADFSANALENPVAEPVAPKAACCGWRKMVQVPLLLFAAGGIGFAGQQMWSEPDFAALITGQPVSHAGGSCGSSMAAMSTCPSAAMANSQSTQASCSMQAAQYAGGCCASQAAALAAAEAAMMEDAVSALSPMNGSAVEGETL
jgi:hypothetical protein